MKKVLCIAQSCCDMIFGNLPRMPGPGEEVYGDSFTIRPGGGANTPINLGKLGGNVAFLTGIGADALGEQILTELRSSGVSVCGMVGQSGTRTAVSAVLSTPQDRGFASFAGTEGEFFTQEQLDEAIRNADIVHTYLGYSIGYGIGQLCEQYGKSLSLDVSWCDAENTAAVWDMLGCCDWLKLNDAEAARITGLADPEEALRKLARSVRKGVMITLGGEGSIGMPGREGDGVKREIIRQPAVSMGEFQDSCGAGDAYAAGFLWGISTGRSMPESMEAGAAVSGMCVTWLGGNSEKLNCTMLGKRFCAN